MRASYCRGSWAGSWRRRLTCSSSSALRPSASVDKTKGREQDCLGNIRSDVATFSLIDGSARCSRHIDVLTREKGAS